MKRFSLAFLFVFIVTMVSSTVIYANMAAPEKSDIASSITFEKNHDISVLSEVLDITVKGAKADIVATYKMKNTTNSSVSTQSMFLSPNIENSNISVVVNDEAALFKAERYSINYDTEITTNDWEYAVLTNKDIAGSDSQTVDAIAFEMDFKPQEEYSVIVSYSYRLGGYPEYDYNAKNGIIEYYLVPAAMWKDFSSLTINLNLDKDMPIIKSSNLEFKKIDTRTYQYVSDTLPQDNLNIVIDENWGQNILSSLRSPYFVMTLVVVGLPILMIVVFFALGFIIARHIRNNRKKS